MGRTALDRFREELKEGQAPEAVSFQDFPRVLLGGAPNPTQGEYIWAKERIRMLMGAAGGAKTTTLAATGFMRALFQPGCKIFISRLDYNDLLTTTAVEFEKMLNRLPNGTLLARDKQAPMRWWIRPALPDAEPSEMTFQGLQDRIVGHNAHVWLIDEADEVEEARVNEIDARLRAPGSTDYLLGGAFNPPDKHHWLYKACTGRDHRERKVREPYIKLYVASPRENEHNLPKDYYASRAAGKPEDWIARYIRGEWGQTYDGEPVYREFRRELHTRTRLEYDPLLPLWRGWDFGYRHPALLWAQVDNFGRLRVLGEELGHMEEATPFGRKVIAATNQRFPRAPPEMFDCGDPSVRQHKDTGSTLAEFWRLGINMRFRLTKLMQSVDFTRRCLTELAEGEPRILVDRTNCPILTAALSGGYHLDERGQKPVKDGFYDHVADAFRYLVTNTLADGPFIEGEASNIPDSVEYRAELDDYRNTHPEGVSYQDVERWLNGAGETHGQ